MHLHLNLCSVQILYSCIERLKQTNKQSIFLSYLVLSDISVTHAVQGKVTHTSGSLCASSPGQRCPSRGSWTLLVPQPPQPHCAGVVGLPSRTPLTSAASVGWCFFKILFITVSTTSSHWICVAAPVAPLGMRSQRGEVGLILGVRVASSFQLERGLPAPLRASPGGHHISKGLVHGCSKLIS